MPHSLPNIDPTTPADGDLLSLGDDSIRQFKQQLLERLADVIEDVTADPWVLNTTGASNSQTKSILQLASTLSGSMPFSFSTLTHAFTVPGAALGDMAFAQWGDGVLIAGPVIIETVYVSATDTVTVVCRNMNLPKYLVSVPSTPTVVEGVPEPSTGAAITLTSKPINIIVVKV